MNDKWEFYKDAEGQWRWRCTAPNGNIVGASTQGYMNKADCEGNARRNGWDDNLTQERGDQMKQKDLAAENLEIKTKAYDINRKMRNILLTIVGLLCVIVAILLITLFWQTPKVDLSKQSLSELKVMMLVLDPKEDEKVIVFGDTHFDYDQSTLSLEAKTLLDKDVQCLKENPQINVRMAGYTSAKGTAAINQKLSERRANAVKAYLIEKGIAPERITVIGYGRTKPALYEVSPSDIDTKEARANMRVLFEVVVK